MEVKDVITDYFFIQSAPPCQSVPDVSPSYGDSESDISLEFHDNSIQSKKELSSSYTWKTQQTCIYIHLYHFLIYISGSPET